MNGLPILGQTAQIISGYRKRFPTKAEALRWEALVKTHKTQRLEWEPLPKDSRKLSELIDKWHETHGRHLKDGENRLLMVRNMCSRLKNPRTLEIDTDLFSAYRNERLKTGVSANTISKVKKLKLDEIKLK